ncbi:MAG: alpha/beta fold hydrolase [Gammaproteobacteria bacterium]|nr:alpha/beta fold hydrolase [Gammaproteobacteria bacterium]
MDNRTGLSLLFQPLMVNASSSDSITSGMDNFRFSNLIYRIIGQPERWHDDYIDIMNQVLDETDSFDDPSNFSELEVGDQIISRLHSSNETLAAFSTLLDTSRFKLIILDQKLVPIYHNHIADDLLAYVSDPDDNSKLSPALISLIEALPSNRETDSIQALDCVDGNGDQIYLRTIQGEAVTDEQPISFKLLLVLDHERSQSDLNPDLVEKFELTAKEQKVLLNLIHGKSIKQIAEASFVSENTVKTHLKSIYRKTETNSQADVIRLILTHESRILDSYFDSSARIMHTPKGNPELDQQVTLPDGNVIIYRDYGPKDGRPLVVFHNGFGCRVTIPIGYEEVLQRTNRRVIIPDRPGFGKSPYIKKHPIGWNERFREFADLLELQQFDILGTVLGSHMAINYAAEQDPRLGKVILASPVVINDKKQTQHLIGILAPSARLVSASKRFAREIYELWLKSVTLNIKTHYRKMLESSLGTKERDLFDQDDTRELIIEGFQEGSSVSLEGISHEMVFCMTPLKKDLSKITNPVEIWYGSDDARMTLRGAEVLRDQLPNATLNVREGYSEHIYYPLFEEMIA